MKKTLEHSFVRFGLVGVLGFIVNFILLTLLYRGIGIPLFIAQLIAGEIALFNNFLLHHHWTYNKHNVTKTIRKLLIQFHVTSWLAIVGTAVIVSVGVGLLHLHYVVALVIAGAVAMGWNFIWTKFVIWRDNDASHEHRAIMPRLIAYFRKSGA